MPYATAVDGRRYRIPTELRAKHRTKSLSHECHCAGSCTGCKTTKCFNDCRALQQQMEELDALREVVAAELGTSQALRDVKSLLSSLTGQYLSPADELATAEKLYRQLDDLGQERQRLFDAMAAAGCELLRADRGS